MLEVTDLIIECLAWHDLTICVRVNQEWFAIFSPHLWNSIHYKPSRKIPGQTGKERYVEWIRLFKGCIEAGALVRNGRWIRDFYTDCYDFAPLLTSVTSGSSATCTELSTLHLGSAQNPEQDLVGDTRGSSVPLKVVPVDSTHAIRLLQQSRQLRDLYLTGQMMERHNPMIQQLFDAIPDTVEELSLSACWIDARPIPILPAGGGQEASPLSQQSVDDSKSAPPPPQPLIPFLLRLTSFTLRNFAVDNATWPLVFQNCPNLESLSLERIKSLEASRAISSALRRFCPRLVHFQIMASTLPYGQEGDITDKGWAIFLGSSTRGWESLEFNMRLEHPFEFGPLSTAELLRHAWTLKKLEVSGNTEMSFELIQQLYRSSPHLTIMHKFESMDRQIYHS
ncbi:hypothetical protein BGX23_006965 [Mortierella sp. AD031]|nr:hypothetical protein BGX23_006965 [Mortierella sp. AD031]